MKKLLLIFLAILAFAPSFASHLMGGQITARQLNGASYEITMVLYRDTTGIPMTQNDINIYLLGNPTPVYIITKPGVMTSFLNGVEQYVYMDTVSLSAGDYVLSFELCCRNGAIINAALGGGNSMYIRTKLAVTSGGGAITANSTPVLLNPPVTVAQLNTPFSYNPMPYDADGDSLVWSLVTPLESSTSYLSGYVPPVGSAPFAINRFTGLITWTPSILGNFVTCVLVSEYRNGIKIGEIRRDMQLVVLPTIVARPNINTANFPTNAQGAFVFDVTAGSPLNAIVIAADPTPNQPLSLSATGEPFLHASNPAIFPAVNGIETVQSTFSWSLNESQIRNNPYIVNFRMMQTYQNRVFTYDLSVLVKVRSVTSANQNLEIDNQLSIYPNPSNGSFAVSFLLEKPSQTSISIQDMATKTSRNVLTKQLPFGKNVLLFQDLNLAKGIYLVQITTENKTTTQKLVVE